MEFQGLFTSLPGMLFTFPSRYWCTIGHSRYLALEDGPPSFTQGSTNPVLLWNTPLVCCCFRIRGFHPLWRPFPWPSPNNSTSSLLSLAADRCVHNPYAARARAYGTNLGFGCNAASSLDDPLHCIGLGSSPFARHYSGNLQSFLIRKDCLHKQG